MENENSKEAAPIQAQQTSGFGRWMAVVTVAVVAVGGIGVAAAVSQDLGQRPGFEQVRDGGPGGQDGPGRRFGGPRHGMGGGGFGEGRLERVLEEIEATPEQEDKIFAIIDATRAEVRPVMRDFRDTREDLAEILGAATVDPAAIEKLRAERVAALDGASRTVTSAMVEVAGVLTAEQRAELLKLLEEHGPRRQ